MLKLWQRTCRATHYLTSLRLLAAGGMLLVGLSVITHAQAHSSAVSATHIPFADNQQISLPLSRNNINRLFVTHDKITSINAPSGLMSASNDASGSAYVTVLTHESFTAFVNTQNGHHFSMLVLPRSEPGQTVALTPTTSSLIVPHWEKNSDYEQLLITLVKDVMQGNTPKGYGSEVISPKKASTYHFKQLQLVPTRRYTGNQLSVVVYRAKNITKTPLTLLPNSLYRPQVRAIALTQQSLLPQQSANVIEVIATARSAE